MRRLAAELGVTVRALYHHVEDRQQVIDGVARALVAQIPKHRFDADDWRGSIRRMFREARESYRRHPRALLISLDEQVSPAGVEPERIHSPERMLAYFVSLGLTLPDALTLQTQLLTQVLGFVLSVDVTADRVATHERARLLDPVPASWLTAFPDLDAANVRAAAAADPVSPDEMFERILDGIIRGLEPLITVSADQAEHSLPDEETLS